MNMNTVQPQAMNTSDEHTFLTPEQAARRAGVSRPTINRALKSLELAGRRDNQNRWQIAPDDLDAWSASRGREHAVTTEHVQSVATQNDQLEHLRTELGAVREALAAETARANAAEADRDRWQAMAEKLATRPLWRWPWSKS